VERKTPACVADAMGGTDSVVEETGEGSTKRKILKMGYECGLGCEARSKNPYSVALVKEGRLVTKTIG
jgi:hypothetical protein